MILSNSHHPIRDRQRDPSTIPEIPRYIVLSQFAIQPEDDVRLDPIREMTEAQLRRIPGFLGISAWQKHQTLRENLVISEFTDPIAAQQQLIEMSETAIPLLSEMLLSTPNVHHVVVKGLHGTPPSKSRIGDFLSLSNRVSEPGKSEDLTAELHRIFNELSLLPGYRGSFQGTLHGIEEENFGAVLWQSERAFRRSLPRTSPYEVQLFQRVY
jgi:hypothetical protein